MSNSDTKELITRARRAVIEGAPHGGDKQRYRLLAYGFLRGVPYAAMEASTHADGHCATGRESWYHGLIINVQVQLSSFACAETKSWSELYRDPNAVAIRELVRAWIQERTGDLTARRMAEAAE